MNNQTLGERKITSFSLLEVLRQGVYLFQNNINYLIFSGFFIVLSYNITFLIINVAIDYFSLYTHFYYLYILINSILFVSIGLFFSGLLIKLSKEEVSIREFFSFYNFDFSSFVILVFLLFFLEVIVYISMLYAVYYLGDKTIYEFNNGSILIINPFERFSNFTLIKEKLKLYLPFQILRIIFFSIIINSFYLLAWGHNKISNYIGISFKIFIKNFFPIISIVGSAIIAQMIIIMLRNCFSFVYGPFGISLSVYIWIFWQLLLVILIPIYFCILYTGFSESYFTLK